MRNTIPLSCKSMVVLHLPLCVMLKHFCMCKKHNQTNLIKSWWRQTSLQMLLTQVKKRTTPQEHTQKIEVDEGSVVGVVVVEEGTQLEIGPHVNYVGSTGTQSQPTSIVLMKTSCLKIQSILNLIIQTTLIPIKNPLKKPHRVLRLWL